MPSNCVTVLPYEKDARGCSSSRLGCKFRMFGLAQGVPGKSLMFFFKPEKSRLGLHTKKKRKINIIFSIFGFI